MKSGYSKARIAVHVLLAVVLMAFLLPSFVWADTESGSEDAPDYSLQGVPGVDHEDDEPVLTPAPSELILTTEGEQGDLPKSSPQPATSDEAIPLQINAGGGGRSMEHLGLTEALRPRQAKSPSWWSQASYQTQVL